MFKKSCIGIFSENCMIKEFNFLILFISITIENELYVVPLMICCNIVKQFKKFSFEVPIVRHAE